MTDIPESSLARRFHPVIAALTSAELESVLLPPDRVGLPSSWWGHVPFAQWLVHELKPRLVVELGTQHGVSFSAFCNAVKRGGLATRCFAIDTWRGDENAGFYDESVFNNIDAFVRQNYSSFATLIKSSFKSALVLFADGSIDLLHIDGLHTYDAVKADFEAWLPKLSDRGAVLFHDIAIYDRNIEVWRIWKEISQRYPSFEFHHSCGLGVLAPGEIVPDFISVLTTMEPAVAAILRQRLAELGERWILMDERARALASVDALSRGQQLAQAENDRLQNEILLQATQFASLTQEVDKLRQQLEHVRTSTSWRVMGPYRVAGRLLKRHVLAPLTTSRLQRQRGRDFNQISRSKAFNAAFYLGREIAPDEEGGVIMDYLANSQNRVPWERQNLGVTQRRPLLGFHPLAYATQCKDYDKTTGEDPLAHYLRTGAPGGPWKHAVIQPHPTACSVGSCLRILIHAHFHYPDLLEDFLYRLRGNTSSADLFITTTSEPKAADIREILSSQNEKAATVVVPNRGRDIGPLIMCFPQFEDYDVIGHHHGKRSPQQSGAQGEDWRNFLWDHLIGGNTPMMDVIIEAFAADERLGLIFPEDPNLNHWDLNQSLAHNLADRLELRRPLPQHFEFPKGSMFWARPAALRPLVDLGWSWSDFPAEPVASDGTLLHTLERLIPFSAEHAGFRFKTVHVPHSWRKPVQ